jgi:glyoxylate reductase
VLTEATADLTLALMLALMRRVVEGDGVVRAGEWLTWEPAFLLGRDLHGAKVLVVGMGRIGRAVARRVEAFGAEVIPCGRDDDLGEHIATADVVTLHAPLTDETRGLIDAAALAAMKPTAYLVNAARGPIVDQAALRTALESGEIAGAALDVTVPEPLPADDPLLAVPNLVVVPHIASATHATRGAMADLAVDNLVAALRGERMPNCVNPEAFGR